MFFQLNIVCIWRKFEAFWKFNTFCYNFACGTVWIMCAHYIKQETVGGQIASPLQGYWDKYILHWIAATCNASSWASRCGQIISMPVLYSLGVKIGIKPRLNIQTILDTWMSSRFEKYTIYSRHPPCWPIRAIYVFLVTSVLLVNIYNTLFHHFQFIMYCSKQIISFHS